VRENTEPQSCDVCDRPCLYPGQGVYFVEDFVCYVCIQAAMEGIFGPEEEEGE
jgi:hypothetical protein